MWSSDSHYTVHHAVHDPHDAATAILGCPVPSFGVHATAVHEPTMHATCATLTLFTHSVAVLKRPNAALPRVHKKQFPTIAYCDPSSRTILAEVAQKLVRVVTRLGIESHPKNPFSCCDWCLAIRILPSGGSVTLRIAQASCTHKNPPILIDTPATQPHTSRVKHVLDRMADNSRIQDIFRLPELAVWQQSHPGRRTDSEAPLLPQQQAPAVAAHANTSAKRHILHRLKAPHLPFLDVQPKESLGFLAPHWAVTVLILASHHALRLDVKVSEAKIIAAVAAHCPAYRRHP
mmetsp:Transcript_113033/g.258943  ORF Transcript_113033/g.258943 Transcript_113033/m.258943 type:complete len:290 (-) Transcript_113033:80-949(-)